MSFPSTGTLTFLFTDIEGSSNLWEQYPDAMCEALGRHDAILHDAIQSHGGQVFKTVGDSFYAAFASATDSLEAALAIQLALRDAAWGATGPLRVRVALHSGDALERGGDYYGPSLNRVDRLLRVAYGGQIVMTSATYELMRAALPQDVQLLDLGEYRFKGLSQPERIFQVVARDLPREFPPLKTLEARLFNLPMLATSFIGRSTEVAAVRTLLRRHDVRLVTLTGPGGTGKTRLALQVSAELGSEFEHGVCLVELALLQDADRVVSSIAQALGVQESSGQSLLDSVKETVRERDLLLLLDNFEHVMAATPVVTELLSVAPHLRMLVTSREVLRIYGEHEYVVPPLALPDARRVPALEQMRACPSVALFIERVRAVKAGFSLTPDNMRAVAEICVRLDGLPLAIELAAARVRLFSPQEMLPRLADRLSLLTGGSNNLPPRQQTLRGAIDWSFDLLDREERKLFGRLSVFVGGCTLEAAEAVCAAGDILLVNILDGLASLLDKSLLQQKAGMADESRFVMLETIREYALEQLNENDQAEVIRQRHAEYYLKLAAAAQPGLTGSQQVEWLDTLESEHDNLRTALSWMLQRGHVEMALRLGGAVWRFWQMRGHLSEGRAWLEQALAAADRQSLPGHVCVDALNGAGALAYEQGDAEHAKGHFAKCLTLRREMGDKRGTAAALNNLANIAAIQGDYVRAVALYQESCALWQEIGDQWGLATCLNNLGLLAYYQKDNERARSFYQESRALSQELGDRRGAAICLNNLGDLERDRQDWAQAETFYAESLALWRELGDERGVATSFRHLGLVARDRGDAAQSAAHYRRSLAIYQEVNEIGGMAVCLEYLAEVTGMLGQPARAAQLFGAAQALRESAGISIVHDHQVELEQMTATVRAQLGASAFIAAWNQGRAMTLEQLIARVLDDQAS